MKWRTKATENHFVLGSFCKTRKTNVAIYNPYTRDVTSETYTCTGQPFHYHPPPNNYIAYIYLFSPRPLVLLFAIDKRIPLRMVMGPHQNIYICVCVCAWNGMELASTCHVVRTRPALLLKNLLKSSYRYPTYTFNNN